MPGLQFFRREKRHMTLAHALDSFIARTRYVPRHAPVVALRTRLPYQLWSLSGGRPDQEVWRAWLDRQKLWFLLAKPSSAPDGRPGQFALQVTFYDANGDALLSGVWAQSADGAWRPGTTPSPAPARIEIETEKNACRVLRKPE